MAERDYPLEHKEKLWVTEETTTGVLATATAGDAVKAISVQIASLGPEFAPNLERRDSADRASYIERKIAPQAFTIELYAKAPVKGSLPSWHNLAKNGYGVERLVLTVLAFGSGAGDTITVTRTIAGVETATVLTEGVAFDAITSNAATAIDLAAAIDALSGVTAVAVGDEVWVQRDLGTSRLALATSDALFTAKTAVRYAQLADTVAPLEERTLTLWWRTDNALSGFRGAKVNEVEWIASGSDEPRLFVRGIVSHEVRVGVTTVGVEVPNTPGTGSIDITVADADVFRGVGVAATDTVPFKIGSEEFLATAFNATTNVVTATRAQNGTTAAVHIVGSELGPATPGADPDANDTVISLTQGSWTKGGLALRIVGGAVKQTNGFEARMDEPFEATSTGFRRPGIREVTVEFTAYDRQQIHRLNGHLERELVESLVVVLGPPAGTPKVTLTMARLQFIRPETRGASGGEFQKTFTAEALASETPGDDNLVVELG